MNHNFKDISGQRFGMLTVEKYAFSTGKAFWECVCDCGNRTIVSGDKLRNGATKSCGCLQEKHRKEGFNKTHGETDTKLYTIWTNMKSRCNYRGNSMYKNYGGRGISICNDWKTYEGFSSWAKASGYKQGLSLERVDVNGNYDPGNCTWIQKEKQHLNKRTSHRITAYGKSQTIKEWAEETGIKYDTIERRINAYGWSAERAVTERPRKRG